MATVPAFASHRHRGITPIPFLFPSARAMVARHFAGTKNMDGEETGGKPTDPHLGQRRLPITVKRRIIEMMATFQGLASIRDAIREEFGLDLSKATIAHYDPSRSKRLSPKLIALHETVRKQYVERATDVAIAHQAHRLRRLESIVDKAEKARDFSSALKGLEIAAKEMGGILTNTQTVKHEGSVTHRHLSVEDAKAELAMRLGALIDGGTLAALPAPDVATDGHGAGSDSSATGDDAQGPAS